MPRRNIFADPVVRNIRFERVVFEAIEEIAPDFNEELEGVNPGGPSFCITSLLTEAVLLYAEKRDHSSGAIERLADYASAPSRYKYKDKKELA